MTETISYTHVKISVDICRYYLKTSICRYKTILYISKQNEFKN